MIVRRPRKCGFITPTLAKAKVLSKVDVREMKTGLVVKLSAKKCAQVQPVQFVVVNLLFCIIFMLLKLLNF